MTCDAELGSQQVKAGERLGLFYRSANFDEEVFDQPGRFDILRSPTPIWATAASARTTA